MLRAMAFVGLVACYSAAAHADRILDFDGGVLHDSNLNNAEFRHDTRSDTAVTASLSAGQFSQLNRDLGFTVTVDVRSEAYQRFSGMTNVSAGTTFAVKRKLGMGAAAPWLRFSASAARLEFNDAVRDGWLYRATLGGAQRIAQRWELQARYSFERRKADNEFAALRNRSGDVFDLKSETLTLDLRYSLSDRTLFFAGYAWRDGDVVSSSTPNAKIFGSSCAITPDPVFGPNYYAYKLDAMSRLLNAGVSHTPARFPHSLSILPAWWHWALQHPRLDGRLYLCLRNALLRENGEGRDSAARGPARGRIQCTRVAAQHGRGRDGHGSACHHRPGRAG